MSKTNLTAVIYGFFTNITEQSTSFREQLKNELPLSIYEALVNTWIPREVDLLLQPLYKIMNKRHCNFIIESKGNNIYTEAQFFTKRAFYSLNPGTIIKEISVFW